MKKLCIGLSALGLTLLGAVGCSGSGESQPPGPAPIEVTPPPFGKPYDNLFDWHLFTDETATTPADGVISYEVNAPLFTDYATKSRYLFVPQGATIHYDPDAAWDLPVGTALVKTFGMLADLRDTSSKLRLLETRVLFHEPDGWSVNTYVWSADQKTATRNIVGPIVDLTFIGEHGETVHDQYGVPNTNQCTECHGDKTTTPLGPKTRQLNRDHDYGGDVGTKNQIDELVALGLFDGSVPAAASRTALVDPYGNGALDERVRAYWDSNCGHCHTSGGYSGNSGLFLDYLSTDPKMTDANWGICKSPTATSTNCGNAFDVVPGQPDQSIMVCRVSTVGKGTMPPIGVHLVNQEGVDLLKAWIASLTPKPCN